MTRRFESEIFEIHPFSYEEGEEGERERVARRNRKPSRRPAPAGHTSNRLRRPAKPRPRPQFPVGFPVFTLPFPVDSAPPPEPAREPDVQPVDSAPDDAPPSEFETGRGTSRNEYVRWAQNRLNRMLGLKLPLDGEMGVETRSAIRSLQRKHGLPTDGIIRRQTERLLTASRPARRRPRATAEFEFEFESEIDRGSSQYAVWVQRSLNRILGLRLAEDGIIGTQTRSAIRSFQQRSGLAVDGIVGPQTEVALTSAGAAPPPGGSSSYLPTPPSTGVPTAPGSPSKKELSGGAWVSRFPTSRSVEDLAQPFRDNVKRFLAALAEAGVKPTMNATLRPPERAYNMHWSWKIAKGYSDGQGIPPYPGVNIVWWHGSAEASRRAAQEMMDGYSTGHSQIAPSLTSNHIQGNAVDMTIGWNGNLRIRKANGQYVTITSAPRTGVNPDLIEVGKSYNVFHIDPPDSDVPHWSYNGR
ncbi:MAG TPA: peptidoglycan-binding protein [Blastocatellia bacterium]|nr:peptidoglycan-binding protein [Blastocatellia bacterium]